MKYFLGLDNGGTTTKAAIYDKEGKEICVSSVETKMIVPAPGFVERDMDEMWEANCTVTRNALEKSGIDPADIAGVGVCGHGKGLYLWGKDNRTGYEETLKSVTPKDVQDFVNNVLLKQRNCVTVTMCPTDLTETDGTK